MPDQKTSMPTADGTGKSMPKEVTPQESVSGDARNNEKAEGAKITGPNSAARRK